MVAASAIGVSTVPLQAMDNGEMQISSFILHDFTESDKKIAFIFEKLTAIVHELKIHDFSRNGSMPPST